MTRRTTTTPHRTAQVHHLRDLIGTTVTITMQPTRNSPAWHMRVIVQDAATPYGTARLLVVPADGTGPATWINADKLTTEEG